MKVKIAETDDTFRKTVIKHGFLGLRLMVFIFPGIDHAHKTLLRSKIATLYQQKLFTALSFAFCSEFFTLEA